jgi:hypothetical protein
VASWTPITLRSVQSVQSPTDAKPSSSSDGLNLYGVAAFLLTFSCDVGQSFSSTVGEFDRYQYDENTSMWTPVFGREEVVPLAALGQRAFSILERVQLPRGGLAHIANGIGITGGQLTLTYTPVLAVGPNVPA